MRGRRQFFVVPVQRPQATHGVGARSDPTGCVDGPCPALNLASRPRGRRRACRSPLRGQALGPRRAFARGSGFAAVIARRCNVQRIHYSEVRARAVRAPSSRHRRPRRRRRRLRSRAGLGQCAGGHPKQRCRSGHTLPRPVTEVHGARPRHAPVRHRESTAGRGSSRTENRRRGSGHPGSAERRACVRAARRSPESRS